MPSAFLQASEMHCSGIVQFSFFESCPLSRKKKKATEKILLEGSGINNRSANYCHWYSRLDTWLHGEY